MIKVDISGTRNCLLLYYNDLTIGERTNRTYAAMLHNTTVTGPPELVGTACVQDYGKDSTLVDFSVKREHRNKGFGSVMLSSIVHDLKEDGGLYLRLWTNRGNRNKSLYDRFGFVDTEDTTEFMHYMVLELKDVFL